MATLKQKQDVVDILKGELLKFYPEKIIKKAKYEMESYLIERIETMDDRKGEADYEVDLSDLSGASAIWTEIIAENVVEWAKEEYGEDWYVQDLYPYMDKAIDQIDLPALVEEYKIN